MVHADGQKKKLPRSGELITTREGVPLVVLGRPSFGEHDSQALRLMRILEGAIVVLTPEGIPALHVPDAHVSRPDFINPWEWGWTPIVEGDDETPRDPPADEEPPGFTRPRGFR